MFEMLSGIKELTIAFVDNKLVYANEAAQYYFNSYIYTLTGADITSFITSESLEKISDKLETGKDFVTTLALYGGREKVFTVRFIEDDFKRKAVVFFETDKKEELSRNILNASMTPKSLYDPLSVGKGEIYASDLSKITDAVFESVSYLYDSAIIRRNRSLCDEVEKLSGNLKLLVERSKKYVKELSSPEGELIMAKSVFSLNELLENIIRRTDNYIKIENLNITLSYTERCENINVSGAYLNLMKAIAGLIHNSVKYVIASGRKGRISVSLKTRDEDAVIEISDNGIGLSESTFKCINERDTDISHISGDEKSEALNYQVISSYIALNNGSVYLKNQKEKGSLAVVRLPLLSKRYSSVRFVGAVYDADVEVDKVLREGIIHI